MTIAKTRETPERIHSNHIKPYSEVAVQFFKISVLRNLAIFIRKHVYWSLVLINLQA